MFQQAADWIGLESRKSLWGQFWSAHQRFFKYLCVAAKVRRLVELAREELARDKVSWAVPGPLHPCVRGEWAEPGTPCQPHDRKGACVWLGRTPKDGAGEGDAETRKVLVPPCPRLPVCRLGWRVPRKNRAEDGGGGPGAEAGCGLPGGLSRWIWACRGLAARGTRGWEEGETEARPGFWLLGQGQCGAWCFPGGPSGARTPGLVGRPLLTTTHPRSAWLSGCSPRVRRVPGRCWARRRASLMASCPLPSE